MLQKKLFPLTLTDQTLVADYSEIECQEHNLPKKYYAESLNVFFCEHDQAEAETVHFRLILDKYREDIKSIKNLSSTLTGNSKLKETYNSCAVKLQKICDLQQNFEKKLSVFGNAGAFQKVYSLISQEQEIFRLKDLIESIRFLPDGRADFIGIGADAIREKNYLNLAKILIERNFNAANSDLNDKNNFLVFQIIKFLEQLQDFIISFVDEADAFIKFVFENMLSEVAKLEKHQTTEINYINNFTFHFIAKAEFNKLSEKFDLQLKELNEIKSKSESLEKENAQLRAEALAAVQEKDVLLLKLKDDKNAIDSLNLKIHELNTELHSLHANNSKINLELESNNLRINEYSLTINNSALAIESLKSQFEESIGKLKISEKNLHVELQKFKICESENLSLKVKVEALEKALQQLQKDLDDKSSEIRMLGESHSSELSVASGELNNLQRLKFNYESTITKLEKDLSEEKRKFLELKTNFELKITEANKKNETLEAKFISSSAESAKQAANSLASISKLETQLGEANKKNSQLRSEINEINKSFSTQINIFQQKLTEQSEIIQTSTSKINFLEQELSEYKLNFTSNNEVEKREAKINELNSLIFDLKCLNTALNRRISDLEALAAEAERKASLSATEKDALNAQYRDLLAQFNSNTNDSSKKRTDEDRRIIDISIRLSEISKLYEADQKKIREFDSLMKQEREKQQQAIFILEKQVKDLNLIIEEYHKTKDFSENELFDERRKTSLLASENQNLLEKNKFLASQNENLQKEIFETSDLRKQIDEFRIQLHSQMKQNEILATRLEEVERELRAERQKALSATPKNNKISAADNFKSQFDLVFLQKEKLEKELIEKKAKITQLQMQLESQSAKAEVLNAELNSLKEQKNSQANFSTQIKNFISQLDEANKQKANVELENSELRHKLNKAVLELEQLKLASEQGNVLAAKLKEEITELRKSEKKIELLSNSKMEIEKLKSKLEKSDAAEKNGTAAAAKKLASSGSITAISSNYNNYSDVNYAYDNNYANIKNVNNNNSNYNNNNNKTIKSAHDMQEYLTLQKASSATAANEFGIADAKEFVCSAPSAKSQRESVTNNNLNNSLNQNKNNNTNIYNSNNTNNFNSNYTSQQQLNNSLTNIDFYRNSPEKLLLNQKHWTQIKEWFAQLKIGGNAKITLDLLMKASRDGFSWEVFRDRCHRKSPTLVILHTSFDKLIGGFTPLPWSQSIDQFQYLKDDSKKSFLFSLTNGKKYNIKNYQFAICNGNQIGPIFGGGSDLEIVNNCNVNFNNFSAIGHTYDFSETPEAFYGGLFYTVKDYEVYEVKY